MTGQREHNGRAPTLLSVTHIVPFPGAKKPYESTPWTFCEIDDWATQMQLPFHSGAG